MGLASPLKSQFSKELFHLRLHHGIHLDERRPGAFETFARQFLRRINAEFAAAGPAGAGLVAWSSTSDGSRDCGMKMLSRCGSVLAQRRIPTRRDLETPPRYEWSPALRDGFVAQERPAVFGGEDQMNVNGGKGLWHVGRMPNRVGVFQSQRD